MDGHVLPIEKRQSQFVKQQRQNNKVFGLGKAELWSGSKQLIDFLDDLFSEERTAQTKFARPVSIFIHHALGKGNQKSSNKIQHKYVNSNREELDCLRPYVELVTLECFTLWVPGHAL
jgi:hypothetical protein